MLTTDDGDTSAAVLERRSETARLLALALAVRPGGADPAARLRLENDVVRLNLPVAHAVARRYRHRGIPDEDLDQVAGLGLVKAVRGFDPAHGADFLSYAVPTVRGEIRRHFRDAGWTVRPTRAVQEAQARITACEPELAQRLGRAPRPHEIAEHLGLRLAVVLDAVGANGLFSPDSLDDAVHGGEHASRLARTEPAYELVDALVSLRPLVGALGERERRILELRYYGERTQQQIGRELGVSQEQVSRLLTQILGRMRRGLAREAA